ncbi:YybH family protein [Mariniphaga sp.]|uniref:YybH family protein n=1 Tax=Mariniphaga sp. TaxID=1954475 RepID=UPI003562EC9F
MKTISITSAFVLLLCFYSCSGPEPKTNLDLKVVETELRAFESNHRTAIDKKDIAGILQYYATDLITISPDEPILYGKDWIRTLVTDLYKTYDFHEDFKFIDIRIVGDRVAASYTFKQQMIPLSGGDTITQTGKGMCILKHSETGTWPFEWNAYHNN